MTKEETCCLQFIMHSVEVPWIVRDATQMMVKTPSQNGAILDPKTCYTRRQKPTTRRVRGPGLQRCRPRALTRRDLWRYISIRGNRREPRRFFGARLCAEHQPQRVGTARNSCFTPTLCAVPARCGWSCGHSRAPLVAALPRWEVCVFPSLCAELSGVTAPFHARDPLELLDTTTTPVVDPLSSRRRSGERDRERGFTKFPPVQ